MKMMLVIFSILSFNVTSQENGPDSERIQNRRDRVEERQGRRETRRESRQENREEHRGSRQERRQGRR